MHVQPITQRVIQEPVPEFSEISYAGDGRLFELNGVAGAQGITLVYTGAGAPLPYVNTLTETVDSEGYAKFYCDYLITSKLRLQGADLKVTGGGPKDFVAFEILYMASEVPELWVLGKRFVKRFYISTDFEDQDTPQLSYGKTLEPGKFIIRTVYYKHVENANNILARINYILHDVSENQ